MQRSLILVLAWVAVLGIEAPARDRRPGPVLVRYVVDGDTIDIAEVGRVRLLGIDAPERARGFDSAEPFAQEATDRLAGLIGRRWVRLEYDGDRVRDTYRRRLAYVFREDGTFINAIMVREGLARVSARRWLARLEELKRAEAEAKMLRRGIWGGRPSIPPERYVLPRTPRRRRGAVGEVYTDPKPMPSWRWPIALPLIAAAAAVCTTARRAETPAPAPTVAARPDFDRAVRPILERQCRPCHFEGGVMHAKLPFDRAETIRTLGDRLFTRIRNPEEQATIRAFLSGR